MMMHRETSEYLGYAFLVLCLPSPIIAAFLRLKLERRKNLIFCTQVNLKLRSEHIDLFNLRSIHLF